MSTELRDVIAQVQRDHTFRITGESDQPLCCECQEGRSGPDGWMLTMEPGEHPAHLADAVLAALHGHLFTADDARLFRRSIDWIASELRDQGIEPGEYLLTRTMLNDMITRLDEYTALVGSETPWAKQPGEDHH